MEFDRFSKGKLGIAPGTWKNSAASTKHEDSDMLPESQRIRFLPRVESKEQQEGLAKLATLTRDGIITEAKARELTDKFFPAIEAPVYRVFRSGKQVYAGTKVECENYIRRSGKYGMKLVEPADG